VNVQPFGLSTTAVASKPYSLNSSSVFVLKTQDLVIPFKHLFFFLGFGKFIDSCNFFSSTRVYQHWSRKKNKKVNCQKNYFVG